MLVHRSFPDTALSSESEPTTSHPKATSSSSLSYAPREASEGLAEGLEFIALGITVMHSEQSGHSPQSNASTGNCSSNREGDGSYVASLTYQPNPGQASRLAGA